MSFLRNKKHFYNKLEFTLIMSENMLSMLGTRQMDHGTTGLQFMGTLVKLDCMINGPQDEWTD